MSLRDFPDIDEAVRFHDQLEQYHRRQAHIERSMGLDPTANEKARDEHHWAVGLLTREVLVVRRVA